MRGLLLCGGAAVRFGGGKLLAAVPGRDAPVGVLAAQSLLDGVGNVLAVVRPGDDELALYLQQAGCEVQVAPEAVKGIGSSLAAAVRASAGADGWLVALGDMPGIAAGTHVAVAHALARGARIAAAVDAATGRRGHPVGFARDLYAELAALEGDEGARSVVARHGGDLVEVPVADAGILLDIDAPPDLLRAAGPMR